MDIFRYLEADHEHLKEKLRDLTRNYTKLSSRQVHERSVQIFEAIQKHFKRQEDLLIENIKEVDGMRPAIAECRRDKKQILDEIDNVLGLHIDDSDFNDSMRTLLKRIEEHIDFSDKRLYEDIRKYIDQEKMTAIGQQLNAVMFN